MKKENCSYPLSIKKITILLIKCQECGYRNWIFAEGKTDEIKIETEHLKGMGK